MGVNAIKKLADLDTLQGAGGIEGGEDGWAAIFSKAKRSKKFDTSAPKIKFYKSKKGKIEIVEKPVEKVGQPRPVDERKLSYMQTVRILRPDLTDEQLEQAWGVYHALIARTGFRKEKERKQPVPT